MKRIFFKIFLTYLLIIFVFTALVLTVPFKAINIFYILLPLAAFSFLISLLFSKSLSDVMKQLIKGLRRVGSGDFDFKIFLKKKGQLKELADNFNYMTDRIRDSFEDLLHQKRELDSIIASLRDGLLVLNREGKILIANKSFKNIIREEPIEGKFYWEVIRETVLDELVKKAKKKKGNLKGEIYLSGRSFLCSATFLESTEEVVLVFHDITQMKNLEKMKRDFVANISHELRTPLTAIKGFVETLEEEVEEEKRAYTDIIKKHTERLINIIQDLLFLSELEGREVKLEVEKVDLKKIVEGLLPVFERRLKEKGLQLKVLSDPEFPLIEADPFKIEQMFINLIDNAIKYTDRGEISISLKKRENRVIIEVQDTGIGISEEHLPRIFERFYVVDKSRSRKLGGTGLGLSIVKHIVLLHNGSIDVESTPSVGTKFIISLPFRQSS
ncbi:MAG TPA: sensor histidine kinase [Candidatus Aerophobetes bacterium]|uniref:histidine kinase n=1 Tax=Aerophobetes bacterium TaxID=2030807 RepID=A0A7V5HZK9_UNCAE|nr:sensor histidine kinase [Candidatus Aerophobetes bacterium]